MQKIIVKEVTPSSGENKPTIIVDNTGAKMSGFESGLKDLTPGDTIEAELEIKGKYVNIKSFNLLQKASHQSVAKSEANVDTQLRITALELAVKYSDTRSEPAQVFNHADSFYDWLTGNKGRQASTPAEVPKTKAEKEWDELGQNKEYKDGVELVNAALKQGWKMPEIKKSLGIDKPTDIKDVSAAAKVLFG